ncbi:ABC transporter ATP-binding protein [Lacrimispora xylanolytica]|uniref:ABC transporter ATP-binding protein n=1 Tax=Lacrimispora xylanolytica TaxID=29375 RepID=A0ABY7AGV1_9FIRM|nr:ABC transporter ATP-binding protein [Lacrimispora xylanolytica]MBS5957492.1 ABC transporter ATP-binding protein [Clostridiales bacterium]WAJ25989.1 ABC transporter ATP-binding protein [Lacrimispora xylanolytica]
MLRIDHLTKTYGGKKAVDDVSLTIHAGDLFGFIGHNGAGKTTTIRSAVGILDFEQGSIMVDGHSLEDEPLACKQVIAYLPDNPDLYDYLTGIQYLSFIADIFRVGKQEREERIADYSKRLELTANLGDLIGSYSHGMKQKLALISAFLHKPRLLVLDEPFVGLDPSAAFRLKEMMKEMCDQGGAIFFSTHVLDVAEKLCNRIGIIKGGRLIACGSTEEVRGDSSLEHAFLEVLDND